MRDDEIWTMNIADALKIVIDLAKRCENCAPAHSPQGVTEAKAIQAATELMDAYKRWDARK